MKNDRDFAERALAQNFQEAVLTAFTIDPEEVNVCKVEATVEVPLYFTGILKRLIPFEENSFSEFADGTVKITISVRDYLVNELKLDGSIGYNGSQVTINGKALNIKETVNIGGHIHTTAAQNIKDAINATLSMWKLT